MVLLHLWLSALLCIQQPSVLVRAERGAPTRAETETRGSPQAPWDGDEDEVPALSSVGTPSLMATRLTPWEPPASSRREGGCWELKHEAALRSDAARGHWRAALLPPRGSPDDEPPARA